MTLDGIPEYPAFRKITLEDSISVKEMLARYPTEVSERTFGSVFVWRTYEDRSSLSQLDGHLLVSWRRERYGSIMLEPVGPRPASVILRLSTSDAIKTHPFNGVFGIVEPLATDLKAEGFAMKSLRDEWDYVYRTEDLVKLEGPKYHTQRKEMKKATSEYELVFEPMTEEYQQACLELEETWCDLKHCTLDKFSAAEDIAMKDAIANLDRIGFIGGVVLLKGKVQALTIGERLNASTAVVHFEKANPSIRGLYQVINQQFCEASLNGFEFVNREQDVGEPGLRRAKEGYRPHHFVEKHLLSLR
jgi:hypothetical protein